MKGTLAIEDSQRPVVGGCGPPQGPNDCPSRTQQDPSDPTIPRPQETSAEEDESAPCNESAEEDKPAEQNDSAEEDESAAPDDSAENPLRPMALLRRVNPPSRMTLPRRTKPPRHDSAQQEDPIKLDQNEGGRAKKLRPRTQEEPKQKTILCLDYTSWFCVSLNLSWRHPCPF